MQNIHKSIETDQDFNCRDDREEDASQLSKSQLGAKSKFSGLSKANSNVIEQNLNFIDNMVNQGSTNPPRISNNKTPISQKSGLSPHAVSGQYINIAMATQAGQPPLPSQTQKSFFKGNLNNSHMGATGMTGAPNPKATGSSFYNATMAKTKIQEQNQKEELQKQLMKIFNDEGRNTIDQSEHISETTLGGQQQHAFQLPLDNTEEIENMSDINIAQSVGQSYEVNQFRGDNEQNQHWF